MLRVEKNLEARKNACMGVKRAEPSTAVTANLRKAQQETFAEWCRTERYVQADTLGAILEWFMGIDPTLRALILEKIEADDKMAVAMIVLRRILMPSSSEKADPNPDLKAAMDDVERHITTQADQRRNGPRKSKGKTGS